MTVQCTHGRATWVFPFLDDSMPLAYLALGSNLGDRHATLSAALYVRFSPGTQSLRHSVTHGKGQRGP